MRRRDASLDDFADAVRSARRPDYDWRGAYAQCAGLIPASDVACVRLFDVLFDDVARGVEAGPVNPYHNHLHTLDAMRAMAMLCAAAALLGLDVACPPHLLQIAMLGHDLRHPGGSGARTGDLEAMSAALVETSARACGLPDASVAILVDLILATRFRSQLDMRAGGRGDLLHMLVGEADVMASLLPGIGLDLAADLTREMAQAGEPVATPFEAPPARLAFLHGYMRLSEPARLLGLADMVAAQVRALEERLS